VLEEALEHLVKGIVDHPEEVTVDLLTNRRGKTLEVVGVQPHRQGAAHRDDRCRRPRPAGRRRRHRRALSASP
jgi:hypothetical protein